MRSSLRLFLCIALLVLLAQTVIAAELGILVNWYSVDQQKPYWDGLIARFQEQNPDIDVEVMVGGNDDRLAVMISTGTAPHVVHFDRYKVAKWAYNGLFAPIDKMLGDIEPTKAFLRGPLNEALFRGKMYAVPFSTDIRGLFWNKGHLKQAGLDEVNGPQTWQQLNEYARKLVKRSAEGELERVGLLPWVGNWGNIAWIWTFGGDYFNVEGFRPTLNREENIKAYEWMADYAERYGRAPSFTLQAGNLSMAPYHYGMITGLRRSNPSVEWWGAPVPNPAGGRNGTWSGGMAFVVPVGCNNQEAAARFLQFVASPEEQVRYYKATRENPATTKGIEMTFDLVEELEAIFLTQVDQANWRHPFTGLMNTFLGQAANEVIDMVEPAKQALDEAQEQVLAQYADIWGE